MHIPFAELRSCLPRLDLKCSAVLAAAVPATAWAAADASDATSTPPSPTGLAAIWPSWLSDPPTLEPEASALVLAALAVGLFFGIVLGATLVGLVLTRTNRRMQDRFESVSTAALDRNNERFLSLAGERLGAMQASNVAALDQKEAAVESLVRPLRESLARVDEKLQAVETEREGHHRSLTKHLELLTTGHRQLTEQTQGLRQALHSPNARGRWGELQLRRVVELAGMLEHCDFVEQATLTGEESRGRPDLIVQLPGNRQIIIDAKAPLSSYLSASECGDEAERGKHLQAHARHVRRHVDDLGSRAYWAQLEGSPEFVVLFLPGEPFFSAALSEDPELIERGVDRRVLLAGPTTLIALLRAVAYGWQQEAMAENAVQVSRLGRELFERIVSLNERFGTLGKKLDGAVEAYNTAIGSLESRVHVSARRMADLGIAPNTSLDSVPPLDRRARQPNPVLLEDSGTPKEKITDHPSA